MRLLEFMQKTSWKFNCEEDIGKDTIQACKNQNNDYKNSNAMEEL